MILQHRAELSANLTGPENTERKEQNESDFCVAREMHLLSNTGQILTPTPESVCIFHSLYFFQTLDFSLICWQLAVFILFCSRWIFQWSTACNEKEKGGTQTTVFFIPGYRILSILPLRHDALLWQMDICPEHALRHTKYPFDTFLRQGLALLKWYDTNPTSAYVKEYLF